MTATAGDESFTRIVEDLRIEAWVVDPTIRENLNVIDARGTKEKLRYLIELFGAAGRSGPRKKGIVYCNSRTEVTKVARALHKEFGNEVAFYHGRMPNGERLEVERLFREGFLRVVIATSAFGEGIDLPDVADVVLYHLNFDFGEFNQQAGRAGRDGEPAQIHLLYGERDRSINEYLIDIDAPPLARLREIYRGLKLMSRHGVVHGDDRSIANRLQIDQVVDGFSALTHLCGFFADRDRRRRRRPVRPPYAGQRKGEPRTRRRYLEGNARGLRAFLRPRIKSAGLDAGTHHQPADLVER